MVGVAAAGMIGLRQQQFAGAAGQQGPQGLAALGAPGLLRLGPVAVLFLPTEQGSVAPAQTTPIR